jgi:hypothetical protein
MMLAPALGPIGGIRTGLVIAGHCADRTGVHDRPRPINLVVARELIQERKVDQIPASHPAESAPKSLLFQRLQALGHSGRIVGVASRAGHPRSTALAMRPALIRVLLADPPALQKQTCAGFVRCFVHGPRSSMAYPDLQESIMACALLGGPRKYEPLLKCRPDRDIHCTCGTSTESARASVM